MPGWHDLTAELRDRGDIVMVGLIQEQHPDRCALFMQWKEMDWPIMVDPLNLLAIDVVPFHILIDEAGVVRKAGARPNDLDAFLALPPAEGAPAKSAAPDIESLRREAQSGDAQALRALADALYLWRTDDALDEAIDLYQAALDAGAPAGSTHFRLGVVHRRRFETDARREGDFGAAVAHWQTALDQDPNQYIWRRRIQQYGPRLDKPYSFYDWVSEAREAIRARGQTPHPLSVDPQGAELAHPSRDFTASAAEQAPPDPEGRIRRDEDALIEVETVVTPATDDRARAARIHLIFSPNHAVQGHWNNEVAPMEVWIDPPEGWQVDQRRLTAPPGEGAVSEETRTLEFEVRAPEGWSGQPTAFPAYALYYACEGEAGVCLYLRRDLDIVVGAAPGAGGR